jgi:uncharacterized protein (DUF1015 family)
MRDERPRIYVYEQRYRAADGQEKACRGFFCRLRLEPYGPSSGVRPHEGTLTAAKEDRFRLMEAVVANLSPVLFLYDAEQDAGHAADLIAEICTNPPAVDVIGPGGLANRLWLADPESSPSARALIALAAKNPVTIADGHHRYETALRYCEEAGGNGAGYVLALMYEANIGGLELRPWHRVLHDVDGGLPERAHEWFHVTGYDSPEEVVRAVSGQSVGDAGVFGLFTAAGASLLVADRARVDAILPPAGTETLRWLDVSVLSATLSRMIGATPEELAAEGRLLYSNDAAAAIDDVRAGRADAAFVVRATPIDDVVRVAAAAEFMPAKSTLFYPKAATGLVFNPLND